MRKSNSLVVPFLLIVIIILSVLLMKQSDQVNSLFHRKALTTAVATSSVVTLVDGHPLIQGWESSDQNWEARVHEDVKKSVQIGKDDISATPKTLLKLEINDGNTGVLDGGFNPQTSRFVFAVFKDHLINGLWEVDLYSYSLKTGKLTHLPPESWMADFDIPSKVKFGEWKNETTVAVTLEHKSDKGPIKEVIEVEVP